MQYKVSVVTPFHNVEEPMFKNCVQSMLNQTIGFENIEWIVVLHNCQKQSIDMVRRYLDRYDNVQTPVLDNEAHTPSAPRNYGMAMATGQYLSYLDGDDSYLPNCLEVAVREAETTSSQVVWFRRENEKEDPSLFMPPATSFCDNTTERVVMEKGHWDYKIMFSGHFGLGTSFLFNLDFLRTIGLKFNEKMLFGEDFPYVIMAIVHADRVCYLPQHIGYHYYVNGGSLVQHSEKTAEQLIQYAEGFRDLFALMRSYGIDTNECSQIMCIFLTRFILASPRLAVEDRQKIKEIIGPDVTCMSLLPADKNFDQHLRDIMLYLSQDVILNPENPGEFMLKVKLDGLMELRNIIKDNLETDFGRHYNFKQIKSVSAYQFLVPLTDSDYYRKIIPLQTNVGDKYILTKRHIKRYYQKKNGTLIPSTRFNCHKYAECLASLLEGKKSILIARSMPVIGMTNDDAEIDTLYSSIVKDYFQERYLKGGVIQARLTSSVVRYFSQARTEDDYMDIMTEALAHGDDVQQIVAFDTNELLKAFQTLEEHWPMMVEQIPDENRRNEVHQILSHGFDQPVVLRLWPNLERAIAFGTGRFYESGLKLLDHYCGDVTFNNGFYFTAETILGRAVADNSKLYECIQDYNFYELLPAGSKVGEPAGPLTWSQAETGKPYYLVVTNHAGLYRYRTEHIITPVNVSADRIQFTVD